MPCPVQSTSVRTFPEFEQSIYPEIFRAFYFVNNFNPATEAMSVKRKNIRQKSVGSLKKIIPTITVPAAPIPVHTAYAVPIGNVFVAK